MTKRTSNRFSPEVRERAVRMVREHGSDHASQWAAIGSIAAKIGCTTETLRQWVRQAEREVLDRQLDLGRLSGVMARLRSAPPRIHALDRPSPLAFVLMVERLSAQLSTESLIDRVERMKKQWFG